jgi:hypothetical protein
MSSLAEVSHEIARSVEQQRRLRRRVIQERHRLSLVDALLSDLEELHLEGKRRVPLNYADRLASINDALPASVRRPLRAGVTIVHLMDDLFEIQDELLRLIVPQRPDDAA